MHLKLIIAAGLMAAAGWAGPASAVSLSGAPASNQLGDPVIGYGIGDTFTVDTSGSGISAGTFTTVADGRTYFDYIYTFTLAETASINSDVFATGPDAFLEFHAVVSDAGADPTGTDLYRNPDPDHPSLSTQDPDMYQHFLEPGHIEIANTNLIDIKKDTPFTSAGSASGNAVNVHLDSLGAGTYFLRLFGVSASGSTGVFSGDFAVSAVAVAATPIPPALMMFMTALGGLGFAGWRRNRQAAT